MGKHSLNFQIFPEAGLRNFVACQSKYCKCHTLKGTQPSYNHKHS